MKIHLTSLLILAIACQTFAQTNDRLRQRIQDIVSTKKAVVGIAIMDSNGKDSLSINGAGHFPLQSVFKFHIALAVLSQVDKGKLMLDQKIKIEKKDLLPDLYSPIRDNNPAGATLTLSKILEYTVSQSDNVGCEVLLRLMGGPEMVEKYFTDIGFTDVSIKIDEQVQQANWDLQFLNWTTPKAANEVLKRFYDNSPPLLSKKSHAFLWKIMRETETGASRLKGRLPDNTIVGHKTGSSGANKEGLTAAVNDIGVVFLPDGRHYFISVFVTSSKENAETNERIIAEVSKAAWDYFATKTR